MIKKFNQFINESHVPGPDESGSSRINLSDEEVEWFSSEPALQKLISDNKVALLPPELWYTTDDRNTINTLEDFFPEAEFEMQDEEDYDEEESEGYDEENESMNESEKPTKSSSFSDKHDWLYKNDPEYKKACEEAMDRLLSNEKPESYRDKMKRKVAKTKSRIFPDTVTTKTKPKQNNDYTGNKYNTLKHF